MSQPGGDSWTVLMVQGWQKTSGSSPWLGVAASKLGVLEVSHSPPWLSCSGRERIHLGTLQGRFSCPCSPQFRLLWQGWGPPPFPAGPEASPGATRGRWRRRDMSVSSVTQPMAWDGLGGTQVAPGDSHSSPGVPWHQSLCHPQLQGCPCPCPHPVSVTLWAPPGMLRLEQRVKTLLGRNGTAVHVGDVFIMQNYLVLLCKITVCGGRRRELMVLLGAPLPRAQSP